MCLSCDCDKNACFQVGLCPKFLPLFCNVLLMSVAASWDPSGLSACDHMKNARRSSAASYFIALPEKPAAPALLVLLIIPRQQAHRRRTHTKPLTHYVHQLPPMHLCRTKYIVTSKPPEGQSFLMQNNNIVFFKTPSRTPPRRRSAPENTIYKLFFFFSFNEKNLPRKKKSYAVRKFLTVSYRLSKKRSFSHGLKSANRQKAFIYQLF